MLPYAAGIKPFAETAHRAFSDRVIIGWDLAIIPDGLMLVEANGAPDLDIMQRPFRSGLMRGSWWWIEMRERSSTPISEICRRYCDRPTASCSTTRGW